MQKAAKTKSLVSPWVLQVTLCGFYIISEKGDKPIWLFPLACFEAYTFFIAVDINGLCGINNTNRLGLACIGKCTNQLVEFSCPCATLESDCNEWYFAIITMRSKLRGTEKWYLASYWTKVTRMVFVMTIRFNSPPIVRHLYVTELGQCGFR